MSSPNFELSKAVLSLGEYQLTSGKGNANGYAGLNGSALIDPVKFLPDYAGAAVGSFWVKNSDGTSLQALSGTTFTSNALTIGDVLMGLTGGTVYGIKQTSVNRPLVLLGGSTLNKVWIGSGNTLLGGNDGDYVNSQWSITNAGVCLFKATTFGGAVTMGGFNITSTGTIGSASLLLNCSTGGISSTGTLTLSGTSGGVVVPTVTGALPVTTNAVNFVSANAYYGKLSTTNTWAQIQTFTLKPTFTSGLEIADTNGLSTALAGKLSLSGTSGGAMTGPIAMGSQLITGLGAPSASGDAATKSYVDGLTTLSTGGTLSSIATSSAAITFTKTTGAGASTTIHLPQASGSTSGYLSSADWNTFNSASTATTTAKAANLVLAGPAGGGSVAPTYRSLVAADLTTNVLKTTSYTVLSSGSSVTSCAANTATETPEIPFTGAVAGDFVIASLSIPIPIGLSMSAYVSSAANVKVRFINSTSLAITTIAADTVIKIGIIKFV